ncbi:MAG: ROK family protein, partial [Clostridia bacterium]
MADSKNIQRRKEQYRNTILQIIRNDPYASRSSIKTSCGLSMETVLQTIDGLLQEDLIYESGFGSAQVGRKATFLSIRPEGKYFIGLKFTALNLCGVALDFAGKTVQAMETPVPAGITAADLISMLFACIRSLLCALGAQQARVCGIGIGGPGVVDRKTGVFVRYASIQTLINVPIKRMVEAEFGLPTFIDHSLKAAAIAHQMAPENADMENLLYVVVKSGVGMVVILRREVYSGINNAAGEIGHMKVRENGRLCSCGRYGCLESEIGYRALCDKMREGWVAGGFPTLRGLLPADCASPGLHDFLTAVEMEDPDARKLFREACLLLAGVLVPAVTLLNPQKIIFSGDLPVIPGFLDFMRR